MILKTSEDPINYDWHDASLSKTERVEATDMGVRNWELGEYPISFNSKPGCLQTVKET